MRVAVTGANGFVGSHLVDHLAAAGHDVVAVIRNGAGPTRGGVSFVTADVTDPVALGRALMGMDVVFHLAAKLHVTAPTENDVEDYRRVNVEGTRNVVESTGSARLVLFSTISVYGPSAGRPPHTEESSLDPQTHYARSKVEAEAICVDTGATILRPAAVYGPGMKGNYLRLMRAIAAGRFAFVGDGANRRTLIHVTDLSAAAISSLEGSPGTYNATDGLVHTLRDIVNQIAVQLNRRPPRLRVPEPLVRIPLRLAAASARAVGTTFPIGPENLDKFLEDVAVSGQRIQDSAPYRPQVDLASGWRSVIEAEDR